jgi:ATP-dependent helicase HrpB
VSSAVQQALSEEAGSILVFLPGEGEIRRVEKLLNGSSLPGDVDVLPLYGALPQDQQDQAVSPPPAGRRKIVLATAIAETSLTIEGIRVAVDSGQSRIPRFDPQSGMTRLFTEPVSLAGADQRRKAVQVGWSPVSVIGSGTRQAKERSDSSLNLKSLMPTSPRWPWIW